MKENEHSLCPTAEELAALYDGAMPERSGRSLREHLARCQKCCEDIRYLAAVLPLAKSRKKPPRIGRNFPGSPMGCCSRTHRDKKKRSSSPVKPRGTAVDR